MKKAELFLAASNEISPAGRLDDKKNRTSTSSVLKP